MGRSNRIGGDSESRDADVVASQAWADAIDQADWSADIDDVLQAGDGDFDGLEDDLNSMVALRPSRRSRAARNR